MLRLQNIIREYPWGSRTVIAQVQGRPVPSPEPEAELWVGAHPDAPSTVDGQPLDKLIEASPDRFLGASTVSRFGPRLPYLMKLLAAERPLSVQAHPDAQQARAGYEAENAAGVPKGSPERSYVDPFHKPELLVALGDFEALCGFRPIEESVAVFRGLDLPELGGVVDHLTAGSLREALGTLWKMPRIGESVAARHPFAARLNSFYPGDPGVAVALLLNHMTLRAGQAVWMPAGVLHAYVAGAGIEAMAASDNVLRGGLTSKPVNVDELLRVLSFEPAPMPVVEPEPVAPGVVTWPVPVPDFRLSRVQLSGDGMPVVFDPDGPRAVLCLSGSVTVSDAEGDVTLAGGESAFGLAGEQPLVFTSAAAAEVYVTSL